MQNVNNLSHHSLKCNINDFRSLERTSLHKTYDTEFTKGSLIHNYFRVSGLTIFVDIFSGPSSS